MQAVILYCLIMEQVLSVRFSYSMVQHDGVASLLCLSCLNSHLEYRMGREKG